MVALLVSLVLLGFIGLCAGEDIGEGGGFGGFLRPGEEGAAMVMPAPAQECPKPCSIEEMRDICSLVCEVHMAF